MTSSLIFPSEKLYISKLYQGSGQGKIKNQITINADVKQDCLLSPLLRNIVLDSIMKKETNEKFGISWGLQVRLEDLNDAVFILKNYLILILYFWSDNTITMSNIILLIWRSYQKMIQIKTVKLPAHWADDTIFPKLLQV